MPDGWRHLAIGRAFRRLDGKYFDVLGQLPKPLGESENFAHGKSMR
jgi:hypothetical protein